MEDMMTDKLEEIIKLQTEFMEKLEIPKYNATTSMGKLTPQVQEAIPHFMFALVCELGEIGDAINWKSWKKTKKEVDMDNLRMEFIDALHFLLEMMIMCGMDAKTIYNEYIKKMSENWARQARGY
jgi:dimeric dUTPase (all-alpha-NTP-PPase superfamily)